jgi:phosphatidylinositol alpha-1,6-mannosyltransferase
VKKNLVAKIYEDNDIVICDSWKSINAVPEKVNKIIVFAHGQEYLATKKTKLIKKSLYRANHIISSSNYTLDLINNMNITEIKKSVIPPTYSLKATDENNIFKQPTKKVSILSITRLEERKGIIPVLKSLGYLHKEKLIKPFIWKICGEGEQENEIKNYIDNLGLSKHVRLLGRVSNEIKNQLLKKADLFVMPSYKVRNSIEGFGISYIEAASYGVPSIAGVEGGIRDANWLVC